jgi:hypothetical protein
MKVDKVLLNELYNLFPENFIVDKDSIFYNYQNLYTIVYKHNSVKSNSIYDLNPYMSLHISNIILVQLFLERNFNAIRNERHLQYPFLSISPNSLIHFNISYNSLYFSNNSEAIKLAKKLFEIYDEFFISVFYECKNYSDIYKNLLSSKLFELEKFDLGGAKLLGIYILTLLADVDDYIQDIKQLIEDNKDKFWDQYLDAYKSLVQLLEKNNIWQILEKAKSIAHMTENEIENMDITDLSSIDDNESLVEENKYTEFEGFDKNGKPSGKFLEDGNYELMFEFMPPDDEDDNPVDHPVFDNFDSYLEQQVGCKVIWDDRERFIFIDPPKNIEVILEKMFSVFWENLEN